MPARYFEFSDGKTQKFWQIEEAGPGYTVAYGRTGTAGQSQTKVFESEEKRMAEVAKIIREKTGKGYVEMNGGQPVGLANQATDTVRKPASAAGDKTLATESIQKLGDLLEQSDQPALLPFFQNVPAAHYPALRKEIKRLRQHYNEWIQITRKDGDTEHTRRGSAIQRTMADLAALALLPPAELRHFDITDLLKRRDKAEYAQVMDYLAWRGSEWLIDFLKNQSRSDASEALYYWDLRRLEAGGFIQYQPELYVRALTPHDDHYFREPYNSRNALQQELAHILADEHLLSRDLPLFFEYETDIHDDYYLELLPEAEQTARDRYTAKSKWETVILTALETGRLDRRWLLESCIAVQTKDWKPALRSFFRKIAERATPAPGELLSLQPQLFQCLGAQQAHAVNWAAGLLKASGMAGDPDAGALAEWAGAVMMRQDCKTGIRALMALMEQSLKADPAARPALLAALADVFVLQDLPLQTKAAGIIIQYRTHGGDALEEKLAAYEPQMMGTIGKELNAAKPSTGVASGEAHTLPKRSLDDTTRPVSYQFADAPPPPICLADCTPVVLPQTWNDLLFAIGRFISGEDPLDAEILMNAFLLPPADMPALEGNEQLQPYIRQLDKTWKDGWVWKVTKQWLTYLTMPGPKAGFKDSEQWYEPMQTLLLHRYRLQHTDSFRRRGVRLPLLSLPTHAPSWIAPAALVERLLAWVAAGEPIDSIDLAIALARTPLDGAELALPLAEPLPENLRDLIRYHLGAHQPLPVMKQEHGIWANVRKAFGKKEESSDLAHLWAVAARTRYPSATFPEFAGSPVADVPNVSSPFHPAFTIKERWYNHGRSGERSPSWYELQVDFPHVPRPGSALLYSNDLTKQKEEHYYRSALNEGADVLYWQRLIPQFNSPLFATMLKYLCVKSDLSKGVLTGLGLMQDTLFAFGPESLAMLACGLLGEKKEHRATAAEVCILHISQSTLDVAALGALTGRLIAGDYAPAQRLADSIVPIKDIGPQHNAALRILIEAAFSPWQQQGTMPKNTRKLLEIYLDILVKTNALPDEGTTAWLQSIKNPGVLKTIIRSILKLK